MKVIDLLNKIANSEEVPKRIKVDDKEYYYDETDIAEFYRYRGILEEELITDYTNLNDEVEIIEEDKKIKKLKHAKEDDILVNGKSLLDKIDEIIDIVNKLKVDRK